MATKDDLKTRRSILIEAVGKATDTKTRMELQLELSKVNADLKHLNKLEAADAKHAADVKRALGRKEAEANTARHHEREERYTTGVEDRDEVILSRAKQLLRELDRYPRILVGARETRIEKLIEPLTEFIEAQKVVIKNRRAEDAERDAKWRAAWKDGDSGKADDNARG